jgi:hypothetical protein
MGTARTSAAALVARAHTVGLADLRGATPPSEATGRMLFPGRAPALVLLGLVGLAAVVARFVLILGERRPAEPIRPATASVPPSPVPPSPPP